MPDPELGDIIFPQAETQSSISQLLTSLRRSNLSIHNRLTSILSDSRFVLRVRDDLGRGRRPLIANERCGSWYIRPGDKAESAYFKSTDGHERAWKFSTRRLNLHLVDLIEKNDGIIIVDSTRRGKRMPDALSTTIPIWCTVINQYLLPDHPLSQNLFLPPSHSSSTHSQISSLIPEFLSSLRALDLQNPPRTLTKPLRPYWITQDNHHHHHDQAINDSSNSDNIPIFDDYRPVICCTASRRIAGSSIEADHAAAGYIQGAADDTENWAHGLTPDVFWSCTEELLSASEDELPSLIPQLVERHRAAEAAAAVERQNRGHLSNSSKAGECDNEQARQHSDPRRIRLTPHISVCPLPIASLAKEEVGVALTPQVTSKESWLKNSQYMEVGVGQHKAASRNLRTALPDICNFVAEQAIPKEGHPKQIVVACETGREISVGAALALSSLLFGDDGQPRKAEEKISITKTHVKRRLGSIMTAYPGANPSRNTLQSVNSFLIEW